MINSVKIGWKLQESNFNQDELFGSSCSILDTSFTDDDYYLNRALCDEAMIQHLMDMISDKSYTSLAHNYAFFKLKYIFIQKYFLIWERDTFL